MIGTVEEAKKWECPLTFSGNNGSGWCIADKCAAWRWRGWGMRTYYGPDSKPDKVIINDDPSAKFNQDRFGYCGAFGRPEAE